MEDGQLAKFLPGTNEEAFNLKKYKEEVMEDYKQTTFYLCTAEDLLCCETLCSQLEDENMNIGIGGEGENRLRLDDNAGPSGCSTWVPSTRTRVKQEVNRVLSQNLGLLY